MAFHPQIDGQIKRVNGVLNRYSKNMLALIKEIGANIYKAWQIFVAIPQCIQQQKCPHSN
jgi:hypothetical protein